MMIFVVIAKSQDLHVEMGQSVLDDEWGQTALSLICGLFGVCGNRLGNCKTVARIIIQNICLHSIVNMVTPDLFLRKIRLSKSWLKVFIPSPYPVRIVLWE